MTASIVTEIINTLNLYYLISGCYSTAVSPAAAAGPTGLLLSPVLPRCLAPGQVTPTGYLPFCGGSQGSTGGRALVKDPSVRTRNLHSANKSASALTLLLPSAETCFFLLFSSEQYSNTKRQTGAEKLIRWSFLDASLTKFFFFFSP